MSRGRFRGVMLVVGTAVVGPLLATSEAARIDVPCDVTALVSAINTANAAGEPTTLDLADECTYTLAAFMVTPAGLSITGQLKIKGNDATIRRSPAVGTSAFRIMQIFASAEVKISNLTIANGLATSEAPGGGIRNLGTLTLRNVTLTNNQAGTGPDNRTGGGGGAIFNAAVLKARKVTLTNNRGGNGGTGSVDGSSGGAGGGVYNAGEMVLTGTLTGNTGGTGGAGNPMFGAFGPGGSGGGVYNAAGATAKIRAIITGNSGGAGGFGYAPGGGIANDGEPIKVRRNKVTDNNPDNCAPAGSVLGCEN